MARPKEGVISTEILVVVALILANGLFAGAEIAVISVRHTRLLELAERGGRRARALLRLRERPEHFLATAQVGVTVVSAAAAAFSGATIAAHLRPLFEQSSILAPHAEAVSLGLVVAGVSFLSLVLGELVPKSLALRAGERYALMIAPLLLGLSVIARPLVWFLTAASNLVLRPFGDRTTFTEARHSPQELQQLLEESAKAGTVDASAGEIASRALELPELTVAAAMVPRHRIVAIPRGADQTELRRILLEEGHARMPVYEGSLDHVIGYVTAKDALHFALERQLVVLDDLLRPAFFVPESARAIRVLRELQVRRTNLALVVDEHGSLSGLITLEDLLEELVGEIQSEDQEVEALFHRQTDGTIIARAETPLRELNRALGLELPEGDSYSTLGGLVMMLTGRVPERGHRIPVASLELTIVEASPHVVRLVAIKTPAARHP